MLSCRWLTPLSSAWLFMAHSSLRRKNGAPPTPLFLWINVSSWATEYLPGKGLSDILKCFYLPCQYISIIFIIISVPFFSNFCSNYMILGSTSLGFSVDSGDENSRTLLMNVAVNGKVQVPPFLCQQHWMVFDGDVHLQVRHDFCGLHLQYYT